LPADASRHRVGAELDHRLSAACRPAGRVHRREEVTHTWRASAAILWAAVSIAVGPRPLALAPEWSGDEALARRVRSLAGERAGTRAIAVALVSDEGVRFAGLGTASPSGSGPVDEDSGFEIGSIAKAMNGMLLGDLIS